MGTRIFFFQMAPVLVSRYNEIYNAVCDAPTNKVQLSNGGGNSHEFYALCPTERIKELLGVPIKTGLVGDVYNECFSLSSLVRDIFSF